MMFGPEPRLPIDFLLGRIQQSSGGGVHEWITEHQARMQVAFEGAQERLKAVAEHRKNQHDQHVYDQVVRAPKDRGLCLLLNLWTIWVR